MLQIFIDESGTLPDVNDKFIVLSGVATFEISKSENLISNVLKNLREQKKSVSELKFYKCGDRTKKYFLSLLNKDDFDIFLLIINKNNRKIADTPENFSFLVALLIKEIECFYKNQEMNIFLDRHFFCKVDLERFNQSLENFVSTQYKIEHVDSQHNLLVNIADMVAGATLWQYTGKDGVFYDNIKESIITEKVLNWTEAKKICLNKKSLKPVQAPI